MLYHPCARKEDVDKLKAIVEGCLRRHVITPYNKLPLSEVRTLIRSLPSQKCESISKLLADYLVENYREKSLTRSGLQFGRTFGWSRKNRGPLWQPVWHDKNSSTLKVIITKQRSKFCNFSSPTNHSPNHMVQKLLQSYLSRDSENVRSDKSKSSTYISPTNNLSKITKKYNEGGKVGIQWWTRDKKMLWLS